MRLTVLTMLVLLQLNLSAIAANSASAMATESKPDATLRMTGGSIAAGLGYVWGHGVLQYQGKAYPFRISGISVLDVGGARLAAIGAVYHLKNLRDLNGRYVAASEGLAVISGSSGLYLKNDRGVVVKLLAADKGIRFNLGADGMQLALEN